MSIDDELLMAYADGALSPEDAEVVEKAMRSDPAVADKVAAYRRDRELLAEAYAAPMREAPPPHLLDAVDAGLERLGDGAGDGERGGSVVPFRSRRAPRAPGGFDWRLPLAASVALIIGAVAGRQLPGLPNSVDHALVRADAAAIDPGNPLFVALETTPGGQPYPLAQADREGGDVIVPVLTFRSHDGRFCREFEINSQTAVSVGIACREPDYWKMEILLAAEDRPADSTTYQAASGYSEEALSVIVDKLMAEDPLGMEAEADLIGRGWRHVSGNGGDTSSLPDGAQTPDGRSVRGRPTRDAVDEPQPPSYRLQKIGADRPVRQP